MEENKQPATDSVRQWLRYESQNSQLLKTLAENRKSMKLLRPIIEKILSQNGNRLELRFSNDAERTELGGDGGIRLKNERRVKYISESTLVQMVHDSLHQCKESINAESRQPTIDELSKHVAKTICRNRVEYRPSIKRTRVKNTNNMSF